MKVCPTKVSCYTVYYRDSTLRHVTLHNACYLEIFLNFCNNSFLSQPNNSTFQQSIYGTGITSASFVQPFSRYLHFVCCCTSAFDHFSCQTTSGILHEIMYTACPMQVQTFNACYPIFQSLVCTYVLHMYTPLSCNTLQTSHHNWTIWENEA